MGVIIEGMRRRIGRDCTLEVSMLRLSQGSATLVLGPSGSGKSSFLRLLAGLDRPDAGSFRLNGLEMCGPSTFVAPYRRGIALLSQDFGLWPHLSAVEHLAFVRSRGRSLAEQSEDRDLLSQVGLEGKARALPTELSGGEQQRLALARALIARPTLLLLDEPFANVDVVLAAQLQGLIDRLRRSWGFTLVQVVHYAHDALATADMVAIFEKGLLRQSGTWEAIADSPADGWTRQMVEVFA